MSHIPFLISCILQLLRHFQAADARGKQQVLNYYFFILVDFFSDIFNTQIIWDLNLRLTRNELEVSIRFQIVLRFEGVWERQNGLETPLLVNVVLKAAAIGASTQNSSAAAEGWETYTPAFPAFHRHWIPVPRKSLSLSSSSVNHWAPPESASVAWKNLY